MVSLVVTTFGKQFNKVTPIITPKPQTLHQLSVQAVWGVGEANLPDVAVMF